MDQRRAILTFTCVVSLLRLLQRERQTVDSLTSLGLSNGQAVELLTHPTIAEAQSSSAALDGMFDASDRIEGGDVIVYWNDIEKDKRYVLPVRSSLE